jgi:hypothetical protein
MMCAPAGRSTAVVRRGADCGRDDAADADTGRRWPDAAAVSPRDWANEGLRESGVWLTATGTSGCACASFRRVALLFLSCEAIMAGDTNDEAGVEDKFMGGFSTTTDLGILLLLEVAEREPGREPLREPSEVRLGVTGREDPGVLDAVGVCERDEPGWCELGGWAGIPLAAIVAAGRCCAEYACTRASTVSASGLRKLRAS